MKIGNSPEIASSAVTADKAGAAQTGRAQGQGATAQVAGKKAPEASATLELSTNATKLLAGVAEDGSFDAEKVGRISQAISDGKFTVNANVIADKLIANAQEMLSRMTPH
ncbi:flagellar biosynthesis anti-sigma factor FlgM [Paucibacter aquatile]|uniref:Negative regulator of flagellin synthesis n=1 Tax=Kinneretia aquatilis TaxID=2070761 RepID=A0A2N8KT36_9BURK|nr:flagellar biosynthesis anti-sigma factor FlgM [Paucibacter aquatile]PND36623.1 flagellar biosynthesis anti-sigma factor FlgM [Paucibacter aquatile]WIV99373.1 flagellar biosynthesis anti-sigma factor FlgM [Paucibacter aquatile]